MVPGAPWSRIWAQPTGRTLLGLLLLLGGWKTLSLLAGETLVPGPGAVLSETGALLVDPESWRHLATTTARGLVGLALATGAALLLGIACGLVRPLHDLARAPVHVLQGCPTILWITLLLVWTGSGSIVPIAVIFLATFPALFHNIHQAVSALDSGLLAMARLYRVSFPVLLARLILPGLSCGLAAGLAYGLGICWKVAATAEFLGSGTGVGARIYWAYRSLDMPRLFAWAAVLVALGLLLDLWLIRRLQAAARS